MEQARTVMSPVVYQTLRTIEKRSATPLIGVCLYEAVALGLPNRRTPPLTKLLHKHKWALPAFCGLIIVHVWFYDG